jgi:hypothetical protein
VHRLLCIPGNKKHSKEQITYPSTDNIRSTIQHIWAGTSFPGTKYVSSAFSSAFGAHGPGSLLLLISIKNILCSPKGHRPLEETALYSNECSNVAISWHSRKTVSAKLNSDMSERGSFQALIYVNQLHSVYLSTIALE